MTSDLIEIAWLAGILEGEGTFNNVSGPFIRLKMTDEDVVRRARLIAGGNPVQKYPSKFGLKTAFTFSVCSYRAVEVMEAIRPFMGLRRGQEIDSILVECKEKQKLKSEGKCIRGHDMNNPNNYWLHSNGYKNCKLCKISRRNDRFKVVNEN